MRALLLAALLCVACASVPSGIYEGQVTEVREGMSQRMGEMAVTITVGWGVGDYYEQSSFTFPKASRESVLFGRVGACVVVRRAGESVRWDPCR